MRLPDGNGISPEHIQQDFPQIPVAMITATAVSRLPLPRLQGPGRLDFINSKPIELIPCAAWSPPPCNWSGDTAAPTAQWDQDLIGLISSIAQLRRQITISRAARAPVHIHGESGSGKEVGRGSFTMAPAHPVPRAVNCGAIPPELMESELFGHVKGSFTGANQDKIGLFRCCCRRHPVSGRSGGPATGNASQAAARHPEKAIRPVGANAEQATDIRLLSATHKNPPPRSRPGRFRNDLYYRRINVIDLRFPACASAKEDLPERLRHCCGA